MEPRKRVHSTALRSPYPGKSCTSNALPAESASPLTASERWLDTTWSSAISSSPTPASAVVKRHGAQCKQPKGKKVLRSSSRRAFRPVPLRHKRFLHSECSQTSPRSPQSSSSVVFVSISHSRLHGAETPRAPGGMWFAGSSSSGLAIPSSSPLPPEITVTPPAAEIQTLLQRCTLPSMRISPRATRQQNPEYPDPVLSEAWQYQYVSSLITKDQAAFERLGWKLDLAFAALACHSSNTEFSKHVSNAQPSFVQKTSKAVITRLTNVWNPRSAGEYAISPPSVRVHVPTESCKSLELNSLDQTAALAWVHSITAILGADMIEKIASHIVQALWYTAVQCVTGIPSDPLTPMQGRTQELHASLHRGILLSAASRHVPHLGYSGKPYAFSRVSRSSPARHSLLHQYRAWQLLFHEYGVRCFVRHLAKPKTFRLRVPTEGTGMRQRAPTLREAAAQHDLGKSRICEPSLIDAARLLGELFKLGIVAELTMVTMWFDILLEKAAQHLPDRIEAARSLLMLVDQALAKRNGSICEQMTSLSLHHPRKRKSVSDMPSDEIRHAQDTLELYRIRLAQLSTKEQPSKSARRCIQDVLNV